MGSVDTFQSIWEAFKVCIRGIAMAKHSGILRSIRQRLSVVEGALKDLELRQLTENTQDVTDAIKSLLSEYQEEADREVKYLGKYAIARTYGEGDRPGSVLANLLKAKRRKTQIPQVRAADGTLLTDENAIAQRFQQYYTELFATRSTGLEDEIQEYLEYIKLLFLSEPYREFLMQPIEKDEIMEALMGMKAGGDPGTDGLTVEFYKTYIDILLPHLSTLFDKMCVTGEMPQTMRAALLIAIPKQDKPLEECGSYRPLSLLNIDNKIFAKVLAKRLSLITPLLVAPEQAGFVQHRNLTYNLRTVFGVMQHTNPESKAIAIFLDMEKAFDSVEWPYMSRVLAKMGLGAPFLQMIGVLYAAPRARIRLGNMGTTPIPITRGTRQGCPLSPTLYALVAEPLACALRQYHRHRSIQFPSYSIIISTYADDTLLYVRNPEENLSPILREVVHFGAVSGLKVNWSKSIAFPLTYVTKRFEMGYPLQWTDDSVKYLGVKLNIDAEIVLRENYGSALSKLEDDVAVWSGLPLSLIGRVSIKKN